MLSSSMAVWIKFLPLRNDVLARVVLERALEDHKGAVHELRLHRVGGLACLRAYLIGVRGHLDDLFLEAAAHEVRDLLARLQALT